MNSTDTFGRLILYYTTQCQYCFELFPIWIKFQEYAKTNFAELDIETVDYTKCNEKNEWYRDIIAVPTILLLVNKNKIQFFGERTIKRLSEFIVQNGYYQWQNENNLKKDIDIMINIDEIHINIEI